mgnify:CR=1 FL=1
MSIILSDAGLHSHLLPLTFTRPVGQLRPGILRLSEGWYVRTGLSVGYRTEGYLSKAFPLPQYASPNFEVNGALFPSDELVGAVLDLKPGQVLVKDGKPLAYCSESEGGPQPMDWDSVPGYAAQIQFTAEVISFDRPWPVSYTHLRAHETVLDLVCRLLLEKKNNQNNTFDKLSDHNITP